MREGIRLLLATAVVVASAAFVAAPVARARAQHPVTGPNPPGGGAAAPDGEGGSLAGDNRLGRALVRTFRVAPHSVVQGSA